MKKKILLSMCMMLLLCNFSTAAASEFKTKKMKMNKSEHNMSMNVAHDNKLSFYQFDYSANHADTSGLAYSVDNYDIIQYKSNGAGIQKGRQYVSKDDYICCVKEINMAGDVVVAGKADKSVHFTIYNRDGDVVTSVFDELKSNTVDDVMVKENRVYYVYTKKNSVYIRCIDKNTGDAEYLKAIKQKGMIRNKICICNDRIYVVLKNKIREYSLQGKLCKTYTRPKLKNNTIKQDNDSVISVCDRVCVFGNHIYYSNGTKGIYRCPLKNAKKGFKLYYDAKRDKKFKDGLFYDMCIVNDKTFYVSFYDKNDSDLIGPQWLVKYEKR